MATERIDGLSRSELDRLDPDDREWHRERQRIKDRIADGERLWLPPGEKRRLGLTAKDLAPGGRLERLPDTDRTPSRPAGRGQVGTLESIGDSLDSAEDLVSRARTRLDQAEREYTSAMAEASNPRLSDQARTELQASHLADLKLVEEEIEVVRARVEQEVRALAARLDGLRPPVQIGADLAADAANLIAILRPELSLIDTETLAARLAAIDPATTPACLAHLTIARERLVSIRESRKAPTVDDFGSPDGGTIVLETAIATLATAFVDGSFASIERDRVDRTLKATSRLHRRLRDLQHERGEAPAWLGDALS